MRQSSHLRGRFGYRSFDRHMPLSALLQIDMIEKKPPLQGCIVLYYGSLISTILLPTPLEMPNPTPHRRGAILTRNYASRTAYPCINMTLAVSLLYLVGLSQVPPLFPTVRTSVYGLVHILSP